MVRNVEFSFKLGSGVGEVRTAGRKARREGRGKDATRLYR